MINLNDPRVVIIISLVAVMVSIITMIIIIRSRKKRVMKRAISALEIEKNKLASSPIVPELAKVESFLNNEKLEVMYNEWSERLKDIKENQVPNQVTWQEVRQADHENGRAILLACDCADRQQRP